MFELNPNINHITLDIETRNLGKDALEKEFAFIKPDSRIKNPEKIAENIEMKKNKLIETSALSDRAQIACLSIKAATSVYSFSSFNIDQELKSSADAKGIHLLTYEDEIEMLKDIFKFFNNFDDGLTVVTFNGKNFDLPKLRMAFARNSLPIPSQLSPSGLHFDVMREFSNFSTKSTPYISLEYVCSLLEIPFKKRFEGSQIPVMIDEGRHNEVAMYNIEDVIFTEQAYVKMTA